MSGALLLAGLLLLQDAAPTEAPARTAEAAAPAPSGDPGAAPPADAAVTAADVPAAEASASASALSAATAPVPAGAGAQPTVAIFTPDAPEANPAAELASAAPRSGAAALPFPPRSRWESLPRISFRPDYEPRPVWVERAQAIEKKDGCKFTVDAKGIVRIGVPFVALFDARGRVTQAQADAADCPALAAMVEDFAGQLGPAVVVPPGGVAPRWRYSRFLIGWAKDDE